MKKVKLLVVGLSVLTCLNVVGCDTTNNTSNTNNKTTQIETQNNTKKSNENIKMDEMMNEELGYFDRTDFSYTSKDVIPVPYMEGNGEPGSYIELTNLVVEYLGEEAVFCSSSTNQCLDKGYEDLYKFYLDKENNRDIVFRCRLKYAKHSEGIDDYAIYSVALLRPLVNNEPMSDSEVKKMMDLEYFSRLHDRVEDSSAYKNVQKSSDFIIPKNNK